MILLKVGNRGPTRAMINELNHRRNEEFYTFSQKKDRGIQ